MLYYMNVFAVAIGVMLLAFVAVTLTKLVQHHEVSEAAARRQKAISRY